MGVVPHDSDVSRRSDADAGNRRHHVILAVFVGAEEREAQFRGKVHVRLLGRQRVVLNVSFRSEDRDFNPAMSDTVIHHIEVNPEIACPVRVRQMQTPSEIDRLSLFAREREHITIRSLGVKGREQARNPALLLLKTERRRHSPGDDHHRA